VQRVERAVSCAPQLFRSGYDQIIERYCLKREIEESRNKQPPFDARVSARLINKSLARKPLDSALLDPPENLLDRFFFLADAGWD
jgi:hypothetical protein